MAETITISVTEQDETITVKLDESARGPAGSDASIDSYIDDIETLSDYPDSFPTTPADISNVGHEKLIGRHGAGTGTAQEIGIDGGLEFHGGNLRRSAITGPVTIGAGGSTSAIADAALSIAMTSGLQTALDAKANLAGTNTFTGANYFSSTTRPTSEGTGTPAATSLMTRDDVTRDEFLALGISFKSLAAPAFATSGTGTSALAVAGDRWVTLASGTSNSGWARASIARGLTTNTAASGSGINFSKRIGVAVVGFIGRISFTDGLNIFRLIVGSNQTPAASGTDPVSYRSFGLEMRASGTAHEIRAFGHNGTSITYSSWVDTGLTTDILSLRSRIAVESDGAGNITASIIHNHSTRAEVTATCAGGPTTTGASAQSHVDLQVANSSSGTTSLGAAFYDHLFYIV